MLNKGTATMSRQPLRQPLSELERELAAADENEHYSALRERTRRILEEDDDGPLDDLRERLDASLVQAEAEHPTLTAAIMRVLDTLNSLGI
jgi:hypothetical protein